MNAKDEAAPMPPLIALALAGAGLYAGYKLFAKLVEQAETPAKSDAERWQREAAAHAKTKSAQSKSGEPKDLGGLEWDESTGAYRPKKGA